MCRVIDKNMKGVKGTAYFRKENWPEGQALSWPVVAYQCACVRNYWVRIADDPDGKLYEAQMEKSDV